MKYGKFDSFEAFLESYTMAKRLDDIRDLAGASRDVALAKKRKMRDVVEVRATVTEDLGTETSGAKHQHIIIRVVEIVENDKDVKGDVIRTRDNAERVFVSVRFGDRQGLPHAVPDVDAGANLHLRGEWIPFDKAFAHGGEKMSVLHFTHEPIGFICNDAECFS